MKRFHFLALLLGTLFFSSQILAQGPSQDLTNSVITGTEDTTNGTDTYALNMALSGTASSPIDVRQAYGLLISVTGTSTSGVYLEWNNVSYTASTWYASGRVASKTHQFITKQQKWLRLRASDAAGLSIYSAAPVVTAWYSFVDTPSNAVSGTVTAQIIGPFPLPVTGTVVANQGTPGASAWFTHDSQTANVSVTGGFAGASISASIAAGQGLSITSSPSFVYLSHSTYVVQTYTATNLSLTTTAGVSAQRYTIGYAPSWGGSGIRVEWDASPTAPADLYSVGIPIATSANAEIFGPYVDGFVHIIGSGASSVTMKLDIDQVK